MKCQACDEQATNHITEVNAGTPVEYHVCDKHLQDLNISELEAGQNRLIKTYGAFWTDPEFRVALLDPAAREKIAAYLLPALCLALLDTKPEVRIVSVFGLMQLGTNAKSAVEALRNALLDEDQRVRKAAEIAIGWIETGPPGCFFP
jgi:hypothetical protein